MTPGTEVYRSHLVSRASDLQDAPEVERFRLRATQGIAVPLVETRVIGEDGSDGYVTAECRADQEDLLVGTVEVGAPVLGTRGRISLSRSLNGMASTEE